MGGLPTANIQRLNSPTLARLLETFKSCQASTLEHFTADQICPRRCKVHRRKPSLPRRRPISWISRTLLGRKSRRSPKGWRRPPLAAPFNRKLSALVVLPFPGFPSNRKTRLRLERPALSEFPWVRRSWALSRDFEAGHRRRLRGRIERTTHHALPRWSQAHAE